MNSRTILNALALTASIGGVLGAQISTFVTTPTLTLGDSTGGPTMIFNRLTDARRLSDGRIAVAVCGDRQVRSYDASGKYLATLNLAEGPSPQRIFTRLFPAGGDTLGAYETLNTRLTLVAPDLTALRVVTLPNVSPPRPDGRIPPSALDVIGRFGDGTFVGRAAAPPTTDAGVQRRKMSFYHVSASGELLDSLVGIHGSETSVVPGQNSAAVRLGRTTVVAVLRDRLVIGDQTLGELAEYGMDLRPLRRFPTVTKPVPVTDSMRAAWTTMALSRANFPINGVTAVYRDAWADALPAFRDLVAGIDGRIWAQDPGGADTYPLIWTGYQNAIPVARVELPLRFYPTQFGPDWVLGLAFDTTKVERVQLLKFTAGTPVDRHLSPREAAPANRPQCGAWISR